VASTALPSQPQYRRADVPPSEARRATQTEDCVQLPTGYAHTSLAAHSAVLEHGCGKAITNVSSATSDASSPTSAAPSASGFTVEVGELQPASSVETIAKRRPRLIHEGSDREAKSASNGARGLAPHVAVVRVRKTPIPSTRRRTPRFDEPPSPNDAHRTTPRSSSDRALRARSRATTVSASSSSWGARSRGRSGAARDLALPERAGAKLDPKHEVAERRDAHAGAALRGERRGCPERGREQQDLGG
jgi:hypothetical protein